MSPGPYNSKHQAVLEELRAIGTKKRVVVAMSGGVDSTTTAALFKDAGHDVIGVTLQLYNQSDVPNRKGACCAGKDIYDAQTAADKLGIPHYVFNYEQIFEREVINAFADAYANGETPVPCILCNKTVKFNDLLAASKKLGADYLATGHYVQKKISASGPELHRAVSPGKDQSYFLFTTPLKDLDFLLFPLGSLDKNYTREFAKFYNLEIASKPDSQDICFVPDGDYRKVLAKRRPELFKPGLIVDKNGKVLAQHNGIANYTLGQRKGLGFSHPKSVYVIKIDPKEQQVVVGEREDLLSQHLKLTRLNWLMHPTPPANSVFSCTARLRSTHIGTEAEVTVKDDGTLDVELYEQYFAITPGQACVLYDQDRVLGGGWISSVTVPTAG